jgi:hypothetical protein
MFAKAVIVIWLFAVLIGFAGAGAVDLALTMTPFVMILAGILFVGHGAKQMGHKPPRKLPLPHKPPRVAGGHVEGAAAIELARNYYLMGRYDIDEFEDIVWYVLRGGALTWNGYRAGWTSRREPDGTITHRLPRDPTNVERG